MIQELTINSQDEEEKSYHDQLWVIQQCRDLRRLRWTSIWSEGLNLPIRMLARAIRGELGSRDHTRINSSSSSSSSDRNAIRQKWPKLESIGFQDFTNEDLGTVLEGLSKSLTELDLTGSEFNLDSWKTLKKTAGGALLKQLCVLNLHCCCHVPGAVLHQMMCLMPSLHEFRTGSVIQDTDILQDQRPWVCLGIKTLKIVFAIDVAQSSRQTARETSQRMILSRLAQFKALEYCQLWDPTVQSQLMVPDTELWISLQDEGGLELLETWKQLRWFTGPVSNVVSWGREEDDWAKENWPRLETIAGVTLWKDARYLRKKQGPLPY